MKTKGTRLESKEIQMKKFIDLQDSLKLGTPLLIDSIHLRLITKNYVIFIRR